MPVRWQGRAVAQLARSSPGGRTYRRVGALIAALAIAVSTAVPALALHGPPAEAKVVLKVGVTQNFSTLNVFKNVLVADYNITALSYDLLTSFGPGGEPAPGLAESWTTSEDGLTWTFKIRSGVTWHDGQPMTARDVAFTYNYVLDSLTYKDGAHGLYTYSDYLTGVTAVSAPDDSTVVITTEKPLVTILSIWIPIIPEHIWKDVSLEAASGGTDQIEGYDGGTVVGTGPFHVVEVAKDQFIRLQANKDYWAGAPKIDEVILRYFAEDDPAVQALKAGEVDVLEDVAPPAFDDLKSTPGVTVVQAQTTEFSELGFNSWIPQEGQSRADPEKGSLGNPWITRADVRRALMHSIDSEALVQQAVLGFGMPATTWIAPVKPYDVYHWVPPQPYAFDPAETKRQLEALGFSDTDGNGTLNAPNDAAFDPAGAGKDFKLRLFVRKDDEEDKIAGQLIREWMGQAGVEIDYQEVEETPFLLDHVYPGSTNADCDLYIWGWGAADPDPTFILSIFTTAQINTWQDANYSNAEYDELFVAQKSELDPQKRIALIQRMQEIIYDDAPYAVMWYGQTLQAYRSDTWQGFTRWPADTGAIWWPRFGMGMNGSLLSIEPFTAEPSPTPAAESPAPGASAAPSPAPAGGTGEAGGGVSPLLIGGVVVVVVVAGWLLLRRRAREED